MLVWGRQLSLRELMEKGVGRRPLVCSTHRDYDPNAERQKFLDDFGGKIREAL